MKAFLTDPAAGPSVSGAPAVLPRRRFLVIHNPVAGARRGRYLRTTLDVLAQRYGASVTVQATTGRGDAESLARSLIPGAYDAVAVAGGDGTINEAVNGLAARSPEEAVIPLGVVPLGTANVLAHELGLPLDPAGTAGVLAMGAERLIHPGVANGRCFVMMAGAGLDAQVVERVDPGIKRLIGKGAYVLETVRQLVSARGRRFRVSVDGRSRDVASVIVANGHFYGGTFVCAPDACLTDPRLHVCLFPGMGRWNAVRYVWGVTAGRLKHFRDYSIVPAERVIIEGEPGEAIQGDGDVIARVPAEIAVSPRTLPVLAG
ncbi:diacylglycerol/lipid kinase family protein [Azospirillum halopraeferens]|uniref:diacylglycerol/lipid kinase family protein n=1 Tax=Azospirillum halopraeferens TaxID=34010 RepID=UPI0004087838|nr:diacylglycerol kinase family protein [Azospirillum halopraeferens]